MVGSFLYVVDEDDLNRNPQEYAEFVDLLSKRACVDLGIREFNKLDPSSANTTEYDTYVVLVGPIYSWNNRIRVDTTKYHLFATSNRGVLDQEHVADGFTTIKYRGKIRQW